MVSNVKEGTWIRKSIFMWEVCNMVSMLRMEDASASEYLGGKCVTWSPMLRKQLGSASEYLGAKCVTWSPMLRMEHASASEYLGGKCVT